MKPPLAAERQSLGNSHVMQTSDPGFEVVADVIRRDELSTMAALLDCRVLHIEYAKGVDLGFNIQLAVA